MTFHVGQKVVCVNVEPDPQMGRVINGYLVTGGLDGLTKGQIYSIRSAGTDPVSSCNVVRLSEIRRATTTMVDGSSYESGFYAWRFRPVVERKTDISVFLAMLNPSQVTVDAG